METAEQLKKKFPLCFLPTPCHALKNLSEEFPDYRIYIKRDDLTGLATGGNKARKLEYFIYEALKSGCNAVITSGAQQSNHCRQTAAACASAGLDCHLALGGTEPEIYRGNLLLSHMLGAEIYFTGDNRKGEDVPSIKTELESRNKKCFIIPYGGSGATGTLGYANAACELKMQIVKKNFVPDYIFFASSSGATLAGLILGLELCGLKSGLMPVSIDKEATEGKSQQEIVAKLVNEGAELLNLKKKFSKNDISLIEGFDKAGYGVITDEEKSAIYKLAGSEGILLDPVYTGRAFNAMLHYIKSKKLSPGANILFWHTGGQAAIDSYAKELSS